MADINQLFTRLRLETKEGEYVADTAIFTVSPLPDVVVWGLRSFLKHDEEKFVYREVYAVYALRTHLLDDTYAAKILVTHGATPPPSRTLVTSHDDLPDFDKMTREEEADWWDAHDVHEDLLEKVSDKELGVIVRNLVREPKP